MDLIKLFVEILVYPMMRLRRGNHVRQYLKELRTSETLPPAQLAELQREKLSRLLDVCVKRTGAYRLDEESDDGSLPGRFKTIAPLSREVFRAHPEDYLARGVKREDLIPASSGGSTDAPLKFFLDRYAVEHYEAARWRGLSWWGVTPGSRSVMIWSNPIELNAMARKHHSRKEKWLKNRIIMPAHDLSGANLPSQIHFLNSYRPEYFYGFPSALYVFATLMESAGVKLSYKPKVVVSTAEMLLDFQRETISKAFGCPVANEYGAKEAGILAYECPKGGMHISCENVLLEVLDPLTLKPLPIGERGVLAATDLNNLSMPRPRFLVGDMISLSSASCPCGRTLPLLGSLEGRLVDMLVARDGRFTHANEIVRLARSVPSVERFQICQHTPDKVSLYIVPSSDAQEKELDQFTERVRAYLPGVDITLCLVDDIPTMASGKHRYAIREFPLSAIRRMPRAVREEDDDDDDDDDDSDSDDYDNSNAGDLEEEEEDDKDEDEDEDEAHQ